MKAKMQTKQLWETCYQWLRDCGIDVHKSYCKEELSTHPDYPALTSIIDFLESGRMSYHAVRADTKYIHEFIYPVLAHIQLPGHEYMHIVPNAEYWDEQREITQNWSGIVVVPSEEATWMTNENTAYLRSESKKRVAAWTLCFVGLALYSVSAYSLDNLLVNIFALLSLAGVFVSVLLQANELGFQSQIIKQVCGAFSESGCEHVLKSSYGKGIAGFTPADASFLYFATQFTLFTASCLGRFSLFSGVSTIAIAGIIPIGWSLYTQAVKLKNWCGLCLVIVAILSSQFILSLFVFSQAVSILSLFAFVFISTLAAIFLLPVKWLIKTNMSNKIELAELKKWKHDGDLFVSQWQKEQKVDDTKWSNDLIIGSIKSPLCITVACSPYCNPCASTHQALDDLINQYGEQVCVQIRLLAPSHYTNHKLIHATVAILQKSMENLSPTTMQAMMSSWFEKMELTQWTQMWQPDSELDVQQRLEQHQLWMSQSRVTSTPTLFLNGRKIPGKYSLKDIEYLIPQLVALLPSVSGDVAARQ